MRAVVVAGALVFAAGPAWSGPVTAKDGKFEAEVSARQMSRISVIGDRIASIRKLDEPDGPQMLVETDDKSGDAFVAFDGDVAGRTFNAFLTTESGRVVQAVLHPRAGDGQTVLVQLDASAPRTPPSGATSARAEGRAPYEETLVQFVRLMFNDQELEGTTRQPQPGPAVRAGPFSVRDVLVWTAPGLRGHVLYVTNLGKIEEEVRLEAFLVAHVYAAAASHQRLRPGEQGRVFVVEEAQ